MPAYDLYHDHVKQALINDGWTITHDPYLIRVEKRRLYVDLAAENVIAAEKVSRKIAVEIKSFLSKSDVDDLEKAVGQYVLYRSHLRVSEPDRELYLAVPRDPFEELFKKPIGEVLLQDRQFKVLVFAEEKEEILQWIN